MNQKEVRAMFSEQWAEAVASNPRLETDKPAKSLAFGMLVDELCRAGQITDKQYSNMTMEDEPGLNQYRVIFSRPGELGQAHEWTDAKDIKAARAWAVRRSAEVYPNTSIHVSYEGKARKTTDDFDIEQDAGEGWEVVSSESTRKDAKRAVKEYRENQPEIPVRWIKRRVKKVAA